ncbi:integral peroxisomal membrane peroxin-domain-containing protein [Phascolomyces articulosus]|uniref:Integral peroxisomal membrane peroxin-domain-containing protein n=1 Tax=Phascolomyces articulosus TaxID=60185 RepID=A0AAD5PFQ1_9FUNG|nr:integral peroxisomal membrane peroxin-domain-containing protein [Phascolomyces articulosus]
MSLRETSSEISRSSFSLGQGVQGLQKIINNVKRSLTWENPRESLTVMATWWIVCLHFWLIVIYLVPLLPLIWAARTWSTETQQAHKNLDNPTQQQKTHASPFVQYTLVMEQKLFKWAEYLQWSKDPLRTRRTFIILVYTYIFWVTGHQLVDTRHIVLIVGSLGIAWQSPWVRRLRANPRYPVIRSIITTFFLGPLQQLQENNIMMRAVTYQTEFAEADKRVAEDASFTFVLYENQRAWPFGQWESKTLPVERTPWTDDANEPVPAKNAFTLPKPVERTINDLSRPFTAYHKTWNWTWIDTEWHLDFETAQVDELGWEYGTMAWTLFDRQPKKGWMSTRRRRWIRRARVEYHVEVKAVSSLSSLTPITTATTSTTSSVTTNSNNNNSSLPPLPTSPLPTSTSIPNPSRNATPISTTPISSATASSPPQSPTQSTFHEPQFMSPPTSPRSSVYTFDLSRRDSFHTSPPTPRLSQSTVTVNGNQYPDKEEMRRRRGNSISVRSTGLYSSSILEDRNRFSTQSLDKRASTRDSKKPQQRREAVWKSIVRT